MSTIGTTVDDVRNTFSSWDSCMSKAYCKWPVIAAIIIASLIVLSLIWCFAQCLCCGATLCASCVQCLTCCGCCGACGKGSGGRSGSPRHKDDYTKVPSPHTGYQPQPTHMAYQPPNSGPQFAQFDSSTRRIHDDSLPAMPTWDTARTHRVEDNHEPQNGFHNDVELGTIATRPQQPRVRGGYNQVPAGPFSPVSPQADYDRFGGQGYPYNSDIGAQRLGQQQQQTGYTDFHDSPLSPAPTYRTMASTAVAGQSARRYQGGPTSPISEYDNQNHFAPAREQAWSPLNATQHERSEYQSYGRSQSPPVDHQTSLYSQPHEPSAYRPPSLLQIGRKPVSGSQREV